MGDLRRVGKGIDEVVELTVDGGDTALQVVNASVFRFLTEGGNNGFGNGLHGIRLKDIGQGLLDDISFNAVFSFSFLIAGMLSLVGDAFIIIIDIACLGCTVLSGHWLTAKTAEDFP